MDVLESCCLEQGWCGPLPDGELVHVAFSTNRLAPGPDQKSYRYPVETILVKTEWETWSESSAAGLRDELDCVVYQVAQIVHTALRHSKVGGPAGGEEEPVLGDASSGDGGAGGDRQLVPRRAKQALDREIP